MSFRINAKKKTGHEKELGVRKVLLSTFQLGSGPDYLVKDWIFQKPMHGSRRMHPTGRT